MTTVKFTATKLTATGKKGVLPADENGYYTMAIGGLNSFNSAGQYYTLQGAKQLFEQSSVFMRRVANGCLKGEVGHPKKTPGMTMDDYINRILSIEETNICCHFKEIWLDESFGKVNPQYKNANLVAIMAKIKPSGPKKDFLEHSLQNKDENVCFSIRALTKDYFERGQCFRVLQQIVAFDAVVESGINIATKWDSPALESHNEQTVTRESLQKIVSQTDIVSTEDSKMLALEALRTFDLPQSPLYTRW